ncbi:MAG: hypothetical protein K9I36_07715 [Bacteroidia bacterium]|nr:hypothetical protein [Bacteroidia bacterium]
MKLFTPLLSLLLFSSLFSFGLRFEPKHTSAIAALDTVKTVAAIKVKYAAIDAKRKTYSQYMPLERKEGLLYVGFYEDKALKLINANVYEDAGKVETDQYVDETGAIILIFAKVSEYETPLSVNSRSAVKNMTENWYYFHQGNLIKWVSGGKVKPAGSAEFKQKSTSMKEENAKTKKVFGDMGGLMKIK